MTLIGERFDHPHAAGVTRFQVDRAHRDAGYFECVAVRAVSGTHHFIGGICVFSRAEIEKALTRGDFDRIRRTRSCYRCGAGPEHCECPDEMEPEGVR